MLPAGTSGHVEGKLAYEVDLSIHPSRLIESRQEDEVVIYEIYSLQGGDPHGRKL